MISEERTLEFVALSTRAARWIAGGQLPALLIYEEQIGELGLGFLACLPVHQMNHARDDS